MPTANASTPIRRSPETFERRTVCVVDRENAGHLEGQHIRSCVGCCRTHFTRSKALELVATGAVEWIGKGKNAIRWRDPRTWQKKMCGAWGGPTMQLVPGVGRR